MRGVGGGAQLQWKHCSTAAPIQLQVQTKDGFEARHGKTEEYSVAYSGGPGARANSHSDVAWGSQSLPHALGGSCCPLGPRGGEKLTNSALGDWDMAPDLKGGTSRASRL